MPVGAPPRHIPHMPCVDQTGPKTAIFQDLIERNPIHPGRFHGYRRNAPFDQPIRQRLQIRGESREDAYWLCIPIRGDGYVHLPGSHVHARCIGPNDRPVLFLRAMRFLCLLFRILGISHTILFRSQAMAELCKEKILF